MRNKNWINTIKKIFCLSARATVIIALPSYALVIASLAGFITFPVFVYLSYMLSAYALIITITGFKKIVSAIKYKFINLACVRFVMNIPLARKYIENPLFRAHVVLCCELIFNMAFGGIKLYVAITYASSWFGVLGLYYMILASVRFVLLTHIHRHGIRKRIEYEWKRYRMCGIILLSMQLVLVCMLVMLLSEDGSFVYPGYLIYVMAIYAFAATISATVNLVKYRRHNSPVISAAKAISFSAALVSMLSLEVGMVIEFASEEDDVKILNMATGIGVSTIVLLIAIFMIGRSTVMLRRLKNNYNDKEICEEK